MKYLLKIISVLIICLFMTYLIRTVTWQRERLASQQKQIQNEITKNKEKDIRIDKVSQIVSNIANDYPVVGESLKEVLVEIKDNMSIGIDQKLADLPSDMAELIISQNIETHGLLKYKIFDNDYVYPLNADEAYIPSKWGEYGWRPKLFDENYQYIYQESIKSNTWALHGAWDMLNPYKPEVMASNAGLIIQTGQDIKGGNFIIIEHRIKGKPLRRTKYFHLAEIKVKQGEYVKKGEIIGITGNTGKTITSAHLHFEIEEWDGKRWVNKNFFIGTTHNRSYMSGYYYTKLDEKWVLKVL